MRLRQRRTRMLHLCLCLLAITAAQAATAQEAKTDSPAADLMELLPEPELDTPAQPESFDDFPIAQDDSIEAPPVPDTLTDAAETAKTEADTVFSEMADALDEQIAEESQDTDTPVQKPLTPEEEVLFFENKDIPEMVDDKSEVKEPAPTEIDIPAPDISESDIEELIKDADIEDELEAIAAPSPSPGPAIDTAKDVTEKEYIPAPAVVDNAPPPAIKKQKASLKRDEPQQQPVPVNIDRDTAKRLIRQTMDTAYEKVAPINKQMKALYDDRYTLLTADEFNPTGYLAVSEKINVLHDSKHQIRNETVIFLAEQLQTPELRQLLADYVDRRRVPASPSND